MSKLHCYNSKKMVHWSSLPGPGKKLNLIDEKFLIRRLTSSFN